MIKYYNFLVGFEELPKEITLAINITNCPCKCPSCHSKFLWGDTGTELTTDELKKMVDANKGITCVCFMGGDANPNAVVELAKYINKNYSTLCVGWYSGMDVLPDENFFKWFKYIKIGRYDDKFGPLNKKTTNQRLYEVVDGKLEDITSVFWKR